MKSSDGATVLAVPASVATDRSESALADLRAHVEPDCVVVPGPERRPRAVARLRTQFQTPVVHPPLGDGRPVEVERITGVPVVRVRDASVLADAPSVLADDASAGSALLICDQVSTSVRPTALDASLEPAASLSTVGTELASLAGDGTDDADGAGESGTERVAATILTGDLSADYDRVWRLADDGTPIGVGTVADPPDGERGVSVRIHGLGSVGGYGDGATIAVLEREGRDLATSTYGASSFGLEAVAGIGAKTAARLESMGVTDRETLLETAVAELATLPGVGRSQAIRMHYHARALERQAPQRPTDETVPGVDDERPPLCLDIETDGLSPTILWQIGVYDPVDDVYTAFVERTDPEDTASVVREFCEWLVASHPDRALVTWNGWRFDYRHLGAFVERHADDYASAWSAVPKHDLYRWAVSEGNAVLPGRTNALEDVATALGYEFADTGLDGAATAAAYDRFARTGEPLDWDRHERYCEDDCRALWHVFESLRETTTESRSEPGVEQGTERPRLERSRSNASGDGASVAPDGPSDRPATEQTGLGDF